MAKRLRSELKTKGGMIQVGQELADRFTRGGHCVLNRTEWRGKEPRSCAVTSVGCRSHAVGDPLVFDIGESKRGRS